MTEGENGGGGEKADFNKVKDLRPGAEGLNIKVKVVDIKVVVTRKRIDGSWMKVAEATVGDETGYVTFSARNEQIDLLTAGEVVTLLNAKIEMFKGTMRLAVDKWGKIEADEATETKLEVNTENNLSAIEYELVVEH